MGSSGIAVATRTPPSQTEDGFLPTQLAANSTWRVELTARCLPSAIACRQTRTAQDLGVWLTRADFGCHATFTVVAETMALACRSAMGRWSHLTEVLGLPEPPVIDLHVVQADPAHGPPTQLYEMLWDSRKRRRSNNQSNNDRSRKSW